MDLNPDFSDLLRSLNDARCRYLIVGAYALAFHGEPRYSKDLDIWIEPSSANAARAWKALKQFGAPLTGIEPADFAHPATLYQIGVEPNRIDIVASISGLTFIDAWRKKVRTRYGSVPTLLLSRSDLIKNKLAAGREQDLLDVRRLQRGARRAPRPKRRK